MYRVKHIKTGLYLSPVKGRWENEKTSLSSVGKVYKKKMTIEAFFEMFGSVRVNSAQIKRHGLVDGTDFVQSNISKRRYKEVFGALVRNHENFVIESVTSDNSEIGSRLIAEFKEKFDEIDTEPIKRKEVLDFLENFFEKNR